MWDDMREFRKRAIEANVQTLEAEADFIDFILSKHPKSGETWAHRQVGRGTEIIELHLPNPDR